MSTEEALPAEAPAPSERMTRADRRDQLLDTAATIAAERGFDAVTMEGVAARAGVSKALPYTHFGNADALIAALRDRELSLLTRRSIAAVLAEDSLDDKIAAAVHAVFESVRERGGLLVLFLRWLPQLEVHIHDRPTPPTPFDWFIAELFEAEFGLSRPAARVLQRTMAMGIVGAIDAWSEGHASQPEAERTVARVVVTGAAALAAEEKASTPRRRAARG